MGRIPSNLVLCGLIILIASTIGEPGRAADYNHFRVGERTGARIIVEPALTLRERVSDDLYYTGTADAEHIVVPELSLTHRTAGTDLRANGRWEIYRYSESSTLNAVDWRYGMTAQWRPSERVRVRLPATVSRSSLVRRNQEEFGAVAALGDIFEADARPEIHLRPSPRQRIMLDYRAERAEPSFPDFSRHTFHRLGGSWSFELDERTTLIADAHAERLDSWVPGSKTDGEVSIVEHRVGGRYRLSETTTLRLLAGVRGSRHDFDAPTGETAGGEAMPTIEAQLRWDRPRLVMETRYIRDAYPDIYGEYVTRDLLVSEWRYKTGPRSVAAVTGTFRLLENSGYVRPLKTRMLRLAAEFKYRLSETHTVILGCVAVQDENRLKPNRRRRNGGFVEIEMTWPGLF